MSTQIPIRRLPASPVTADEVAPVRRPVDQAHLLPPRVFHDRDVFEFEQERWFAGTWLCVGREEDVGEPGTYLLVRAAGESIAIIRDRTGAINAFHNVCRHRGSTLLDEPADGSGKIVRIQCPYHAWVYDLDGSLRRAPHTEDIQDFAIDDQGLVPVRLETWAGFIFINLDPAAEPLLSLPGRPACRRGPLPDRLASSRAAHRVRGRRQLEGHRRELLRVPPLPRRASAAQPSQSLRPWLEPRVRTDPGRVAGWSSSTRPTRCPPTAAATAGRRSTGIGDENTRRVYYIVVWPNMLLSLHPDYVMTHQVWPLDAERSHVVCEWLFDPVTMAEPGFDPSDAVDFWDLTNRQDWAVCERQQEGTRSRAYTPGRYALMEDMVHTFDLMVADRYADDGVTTRFAPRHDKWAAEPRRRAG